MSPRSVRAVVAALCPVFLFACPRAPLGRPAPTPEERLKEDVEGLTQRVRALRVAQDELVWKAWTEGAQADFGSVAEQEKSLYTRDAIARIDALRKVTTDPLDARALDVLRTHFAGEYLAAQLAGESAARSRLESSLSFKVGEREYPLRELERMLARERNALRRQEMWQTSAAAIEQLTPVITAYDARADLVLKQLGYPSWLAFSAELRRADLGELADDARRVLEVTEPAFRRVIEQLAARELRLPVGRVRARDLPKMFRSRDVDALFPRGAVLERVRSTVAGLGIDLGELPGLRIDDRDLPGKNPRPLALAVSVPGDVRVSFKPIGGLRAQSGLLHEMGHALHASLTHERRYALAQLGTGSVAEAWSRLFELLTEDPVWLGEQAQLGGERLDRYLAASAAWDLYLLRRSAGHALYEYQLHSKPVADPKALYAEVMSKALLVPFEPEDAARYLYEEEEFFESAVPLEAAFLAHQLQAQLKIRFGPGWWHHKAAGAWLRPLWAHGHALDARELARQLGEPRLSPDPLVLRLTSTLRLPITLPSEAEDDEGEGEGP